MKDNGRSWIPLVFMTMVFAPTLVAQSAASQDPSDSHAPSAQAPDATDEAPGSVDSVAPQYVPSLDGSGLIPLDRLRKLQLLYGGSFSAIWGSNLTQEPNGPSGGMFTLNPYIGVQGRGKDAQYVFQYQTTIARATSDMVSSNSFQRASVFISGSAPSRWRWSVNADAEHGLDSLRLIAPVDTVAVGEIPGVSPTAAQFRANAGTTTLLEGNLGLTYLKSEKDSISVSVGNSYSRLSGLNSDTGVTQASIDYARRLSSRLAVTAIGQFSESYGSISCSSFGTGISLDWQVNEKTFLEVGGGPQFTSKACSSGPNLSLRAAFGAKISGRSQVYATANRQLAASYLGPGIWQDNVSAGYERRISRVGALNLDFGYAHTSGVGSIGSYRGVYTDATYSWLLGHGLESSVSYRYYTGNNNPSSFTSYVVMCSLIWSPHLRAVVR